MGLNNCAFVLRQAQYKLPVGEAYKIVFLKTGAKILRINDQNRSNKKRAQIDERVFE
jgi:hypothetical protein